MVDIATGWTECLPLVARDGSLVVEAMTRAQSLFPWLIRGADFDNDSAFMNDVVVPWCREQKIEVTRSRAYKKNDQAFVEQKNGAVVRRLVGYGRFDGVETARVMARLYAAARLHVNFFQPSFKLKEKRREGAKVIKRYHEPATPHERALAHPQLSKVIKRRLRETYRSLDPVALLAEIRAAQDELGERIGKRGLAAAAAPLPAIRSGLRDRSARRPRPPRCAPHIAGLNGVTRNGYACPPSSIRIWRRSRVGSRRSRRSRHSPLCAGSPRSIQPRLAISSIPSCSAWFDHCGARQRKRSLWPWRRKRRSRNQLLWTRQLPPAARSREHSVSAASRVSAAMLMRCQIAALPMVVRTRSGSRPPRIA
jgi:hypothetical protein